MKLNGKSVFDKAVIVFVKDNTLYYEDAYRCAIGFYLGGIVLEENIGIDDTVIFWVEDDDYYPVIDDKIDRMFTVWDEFELDELINNDMISKEDLHRMKQLRKILNEKYLKTED